jgi:hypothetical protein
MGPHEYIEKYHIIENGSALIFPTTNGSFHIAGILGTPFLKKYRAVMDFATTQIILQTPVS